MKLDKLDYLDLKRELATELGLPHFCHVRQCRRSRRCVGRSGRFFRRNEMICLRSLSPEAADDWYFGEALLVEFLFAVPSLVRAHPAPRLLRWWLRTVLAARNRALVRMAIRWLGEDGYRAGIADPHHSLSIMFHTLEVPAGPLAEPPEPRFDKNHGSLPPAG